MTCIKSFCFYASALLAFISFTGAYFAFPDTYRLATEKLSLVAHAGDPDSCGEDGSTAEIFYA